MIESSERERGNSETERRENLREREGERHCPNDLSMMMDLSRRVVFSRTCLPLSTLSLSLSPALSLPVFAENLAYFGGHFRSCWLQLIEDDYSNEYYVYMYIYSDRLQNQGNRWHGCLTVPVFRPIQKGAEREMRERAVWELRENPRERPLLSLFRIQMDSWLRIIRINSRAARIVRQLPYS